MDKAWTVHVDSGQPLIYVSNFFSYGTAHFMMVSRNLGLSCTFSPELQSQLPTDRVTREAQGHCLVFTCTVQLTRACIRNISTKTFKVVSTSRV